MRPYMPSVRADRVRIGVRGVRVSWESTVRTSHQGASKHFCGPVVPWGTCSHFLTWFSGSVFVFAVFMNRGEPQGARPEQCLEW